MFRIKLVVQGVLLTSETFNYIDNARWERDQLLKNIDADRVWIEGDNGYVGS